MFFIVQCHPNDGSETVTLSKAYAKHGKAIGSLANPSGEHIELSRKHPDAVFVIRRVKDGKSSVRNSYPAHALPKPVKKHGHAPRDTKASRRGKIAARTFSDKRWDGNDSMRGRNSWETIASASALRKFPIDESYRRYGA